MRLTKLGDAVLLLILVALAAVLTYFAVQNATRYWEANHPPDGVEFTRATVTAVDTEELCGRTSKSTSRCVTEVDGLDIETADGSSHHVHAHAVYSPGDEVEAFEDGDGDWQVQGAFTRGWAVRTVGATGVAALVVLVIIAAHLRPRRRTDDGEATDAAR